MQASFNLTPRSISTLLGRRRECCTCEDAFSRRSTGQALGVMAPSAAMLKKQWKWNQREWSRPFRSILSSDPRRCLPRLATHETHLSWNVAPRNDASPFAHVARLVGGLVVLFQELIVFKVQFKVPHRKRHGIAIVREYAQRASARTMSAPFSPIIVAAAFVLPDTICGITEASITRRRSMSRTRSRASTTERFASDPMAHVPQG